MKLLTVSFVKKYNKEKQFQTSDRIFIKLDNLIAALLDAAHISAAKDGRKTIMDRDIDSALADIQKIKDGLK